MSIKRSKQRSSGKRDQEVGDGIWAKKPVVEPEKNWERDVASHADEEFRAYAMTERFAKGELINHAKFGKGLVIEAEPQRVEVLFQEGPKKLGHGQQQK
jgi:hypothetical protein